MRNIVLKIFALTFVFSIVSCNSLLDINEDPNQTTTANVQQVLTSGQAYMNYMIGAQFNGATSKLWSQQYAWGPGVAIGPAPRNEYSATSSDSRWRYAYARALRDFKYVIDSDEPVYGAIAKVMSAYIYGILVDHFDGVPFSQALNGLEEDGGILNPVYDDPAEIYAGLIAMIDEALEDITDPPATATLPGDEDLIYQGDLDFWYWTANSLKLKLLMRMADVDPSVETAVTEIVSVMDVLFPSENMAIANAGGSGSEHPFYALTESGLGNFYVLNNAFKAVLDDLSDPRIDAMFDLPGNGSPDHVGEDPGNITNTGNQAADYSSPSSLVYAGNLPTNFMTGMEVFFYAAEAQIRYGAGAFPLTTLMGSAIDWSMNALGVDQGDIDAYIQSFFDVFLTAPQDEQLEMLAVQMWIAFFGTDQTCEGWITTRKFDNGTNGLFASPGGIFINPVENSLGNGVYPSILLYPQTEVNTNTSFPGQHVLTDRVFWDVN